MKPTFILGLVLNLNLLRTGLSFVIQKAATTRTLIPPVFCTSEIYCSGRLLDTIQLAKLFSDSKTFVDMKLKQSPNETLKDFDAMMASNNQKPTKEILKTFVDEHFELPGKEFTDWDPKDWHENPRFLSVIDSPDLRKWGRDLHGIWKTLGRKMIDDVKENPELYSIIHVDNPVIVPGGRFREFYYWDSYWIIRGLLYSEMFDTARGMLSNFLSIVQRFGYIPNGGRVYYERSQPPLLAPMVKSYMEFTGDDKFGIDAVETLESEFDFWLNYHMVRVNGHSLARYGDMSKGPRPESYAEDIETSKDFDTEEAKQEHFSELKAAAESGMDFSSRWFIDSNGTNKGSLKDTKTRSIIPVELNAILFWNARIIAEIYVKAGNLAKATEYEAKANSFYTAVQEVLWDDEVGAWLDYDLINNKRRNYFVPTNLSPLWMKCFNISQKDEIAKKILNYLNVTGVDKFPGGVPNTLENTNEQWDFPNIWPPMQYILVAGLENLGNTEAKELALKWADRWVLSNFKAYQDTNHMFEKYNAETFGGHGGGGEYDVQLGFGWSNGVIIEFLEKYGDKIKPSNSVGLKNFIFGGIITTAIAIIVTTAGRFIW